MCDLHIINQFDKKVELPSTPSEVLVSAKAIILNLLSEKSRLVYECAYTAIKVTKKHDKISDDVPDVAIETLADDLLELLADIKELNENTTETAKTALDEQKPDDTAITKFKTASDEAEEESYTLLDNIFCGFCGKDFSTFFDLCCHVGKAHERKKHKCIVCLEPFAYPSSLYRHFNEHYPEDQTAALINCRKFVIYCDKCGKGFKNIIEFFELHKDDHPFEKIPCDLCTTTCKSGNILRAHYIEKHVAEDKFLMECEYCFKVFSEITLFTEHFVKQHPNRQPVYECNFCPFTSDNLLSFRRHLFFKHFFEKIDKKDLPASEALLAGSEGQLADADTGKGSEMDSSYRKWQCKFCNHDFPCKLILDKHIHVIGCKLKNSRTAYQCDKCPRKFATQIGLGTHKASYHLQDEVPKVDIKPVSEELPDENDGKIGETNSAKDSENVDDHPEWSCEYCKKVFCKLSLLQKHVDVIGCKVKNATTVFQCDECPRRFPLLHGLKIHKKSHNLQHEVPKESVVLNPFSVEKLVEKQKVATAEAVDEKLNDINGKAASTNTSKPTVTTRGSLRCSYCKKMFLNEEIFHRHVLKHKKVEVKAEGFCYICERSFTNFQDLVLHKKSMIHRLSVAKKKQQKFINQPDPNQNLEHHVFPEAPDPNGYSNFAQKTYASDATNWNPKLNEQRDTPWQQSSNISHQMPFQHDFRAADQIPQHNIEQMPSNIHTPWPQNPHTVIQNPNMNIERYNLGPSGFQHPFNAANQNFTNASYGDRGHFGDIQYHNVIHPNQNIVYHGPPRNESFDSGQIYPAGPYHPQAGPSSSFGFENRNQIQEHHQQGGRSFNPNWDSRQGNADFGPSRDIPNFQWQGNRQQADYSLRPQPGNVPSHIYNNEEHRFANTSLKKCYRCGKLFPPYELKFHECVGSYESRKKKPSSKQIEKPKPQDTESPTQIVTSILDGIIGTAVGEPPSRMLDKVYCGFCGQNFRTFHSLWNHLSSKHKNDTFECIVCSDTFEQAPHLKLHFANHEEQEIISAVSTCDKFAIYCEKCGRGFKDINELFTLHKEGHWFERIPCSLCQVSSHSSKYLIAHYKKKHLLENRVCIKCKYCPNEYFTLLAFKRHTRKEHSDSRVIYSCYFCKFTHEDVAKFKDHLMWKHYVDKIYKCSKSGCPYKTSRGSGYKHHIKFVHPIVEKPTKSTNKNRNKPSDPNAGKFGVNPKKVINPRGRRSDRITTGQPRKVSGTVPGSTEALFYCKCCDKPFSDRRRLTRHMTAQKRFEQGSRSKDRPSLAALAVRSARQNRRESSEQKLECLRCERSFRNLQSLQDHKRSQAHLRSRSPRGRSQFANRQPRNRSPVRRSSFGMATPNQQDVAMMVQKALTQVLFTNQPQEAMAVANLASTFSASQLGNTWGGNQNVGYPNVNQYNIPGSNQRDQRRQNNSGQRQGFGTSNRNRETAEMQRSFDSAHLREYGSSQARTSFNSAVPNREQEFGRSFSGTQGGSYGGYGISNQGTGTYNQGNNSYNGGQMRGSDTGYRYFENSNTRNFGQKRNYPFNEPNASAPNVKPKNTNVSKRQCSRCKRHYAAHLMETHVCRVNY